MALAELGDNLLLMVVTGALCLVFCIMYWPVLLGMCLNLCTMYDS